MVEKMSDDDLPLDSTGLEQEPTPQTGEAIEEEINTILRDWESMGLPILREQFFRLISQVKFEDLSNDPIGQDYGIKPLAVINQNGELIMDESCRQLSPEQRRYIICHELGHRLISFIEEDFGLMQEINSSLDSVKERDDLREISFYVAYLGQTLADRPEAWVKIRQEVYAELIAQYLSSDGTFGSMMRQKLIQFPDQSNRFTEEQREYIEKLQTEYGSVENFLDNITNLSEEEQAIFFRENPKIADQYRIFQALQTIFADPRLSSRFSQPDRLEVGGMDEWLWEDYSMINNFPPAGEAFSNQRASGASIFRRRPLAPAGSGLKEFLNFWDLFTA